MTGLPSRSEPRRLCVPPEDGSALIEPGWEALGELIENNRRRRKTYQYDLHGRTLAELAEEARAGLLDEAQRWTAAYRDPQPALVVRHTQDLELADTSPGRKPGASHLGLPPEARSLEARESRTPGTRTSDRDAIPERRAGGVFLAGHQPELVHPGVWFKNWVLDRLARQHGAVAVSLLVDSDTVKGLSVRVPGGTVDRPEVDWIAMDRPDPIVPYEERRIEDRRLFATFGRRALERIGSLVSDSMVAEFWARVRAASRRTDRLGACLAQARHELEGRWGLATLEVPVSRVYGLRPFAWFVAHLLAELPRFHGIHNEVLGAIRRAQRIRSTAHPVPNLRSDGSWLEAPFWIWTESQPQRRAIWARRSGGRVELFDGRAWRAELPWESEGQAEPAVARLLELFGSGVKIRGRTLTTTLFARLFLGDVFLHGVGGSKYDRVTDGIVERFFGLAPPEFVTVSATVHLPVRGRPTFPGPSPGEIRHRLRQIEFHPERFLGDHTTEAALLAAEKARWVVTPKTVASAAARHRHIRQINEALTPWVAPERERQLTLLGESERAARVEAVFTCRQYAACLFPAATLRQTFFGLLPE